MFRSPVVARAPRGVHISPKPTSTVVSLTDLGFLEKTKHRKAGKRRAASGPRAPPVLNLDPSPFPFSCARLSPRPPFGIRFRRRRLSLRSPLQNLEHGDSIGFEVAIVVPMRRQNERDEGADCIEFRERESMRARLTVEREGAWGIPMKS